MMLNSKLKGKILITVFIFFAVFFFWNAFLVDEAHADWCVGYCYNGPTNSDSGGCGTPCYQGAPWTKYWQIIIDIDQCQIQIISNVCSTADKCVSGETGLRCGYCNCSYGSSIYKSCCEGPTGVNCEAYYQQDPYYPDEGICPVGSDTILGSSCPVECGACQYESGGACYNYCSGSNTSCGCTSCSNCNNSDGWYNDGSTYYCCEGTQRCTCQDQQYRNYYCSGTSCTYSTTNYQTLKSNCSENPTCGACANECSPSGAKQCSGSWVQECGDCDDDLCSEWCDYEYCSYGCSGGGCNPASGCYLNSEICLPPNSWVFNVCGVDWCWSQCPYGGCCCMPSPWCCYDASFNPPTNCSCGEAPYCCPSTSPILCHDQYGSGPFCYPAGTLCSACNGTLIAAPSVTTNDAVSVEETSATLSGNITDINGSNPSQRILEWGTSSGSYSWSYDVGSGGTGIFNHIPTNLSPGTKYYFRAKAHNTAGWGHGTEKNFITKPNPPDNLSATAVGSTQIDLTWIKGAGGDKTMVRRKIGSYPTSPFDTGSDPVYFHTGTLKNDTGRTPEIHYYYRAWAYDSDSAVYSDDYVQANAMTSFGPPAVSTQGTSNIGSATATGKGTITDTGGENLMRYIEWGITTSYGFSCSAGVGGTGDYSCSITGLNPGTQYHMRAYATNSQDTDYGSDFIFTTGVPIGHPTGLSAIAVGFSQIDVNWTKGAGSDKTIVRRKIGSYPSSISDGDQVYFDTGESFSDIGLTRETHYYYKAWAMREGSIDTGWHSPTTSVGSFANPTNAYSSNNQYATTTSTGWAYKSQWYKNFNFNIPSAAEIYGMEVNMEHYETSISDTRIYAQVYSSGSISRAINPRLSEGIDIGGGLSDLWNREWTADYLNGDVFRAGVFFQKSHATESTTIYLDHIQVKVHHFGTEYSEEYAQDNTTTDTINEPVDLSVTAVSSTQIDVSWTKGAGADKTVVIRKVNSYPASVSDGDQVYFGTGNSFHDTGLSCGVDYYYRAWSTKVYIY